MRITTTYKANASGTGQIVAKGGGKQRTVPYNHERTAPANHGHAANVLAQALGVSTATRTTIMLSMDNGNARFDLA